jgi:uncharacterized protein
MTDSCLLHRKIVKIDINETFSFACHPGVGCFTECCRMLDLALTPYDVLRLRRATGLTSEKLLEEYVIIEQQPEEAFPRFYLTMVEDGKASCVFVRKNGCSVYEDRPGACRAYPLGRAVKRTTAGISEHFVILRESHCHGFLENVEQTSKQYISDQKLARYNSFNDAVMEITQHDAIRKGFIPSHSDVELFTLVLYNLDSFRQLLNENRLSCAVLSHYEKQRLDDENLLLFGIEVLQKEIFSRIK